MYILYINISSGWNEKILITLPKQSKLRATMNLENSFAIHSPFYYMSMSMWVRPLDVNFNLECNKVTCSFQSYIHKVHYVFSVKYSVLCD